MKLRIAAMALVYAVALSVGALVVTGHFMGSTFGTNTAEAAALESNGSSSGLLLCGGCYNTYSSNAYTVTVTVTVQPSQPVYYQQPVYVAPRPVYYVAPAPVTYVNPCSWGCYNNNYWQVPYNYNNNYGCGCNYNNNWNWNNNHDHDHDHDNNNNNNGRWNRNN